MYAKFLGIYLGRNVRCILELSLFAIKKNGRQSVDLFHLLFDPVVSENVNDFRQQFTFMSRSKLG